MTILSSARLSLVPLGVEDLPAFHRSNLEPSVRRYLWDDEEISVETARDILLEVEQCFRDAGWGLWKLVRKQDGEYLGYAGLWRFFDEDQPQLLYVVQPAYTGNGYAVEASTAIIDYAFEILKFDHLLAAVDTPNLKSVNVCKNLNMTLDREQMIDGKPTMFFRLSNPAERLNHR